ncbi:hypothetical protein PoB_004000000 [Plakobranchus ocellatus]|uniref:Uncharacterized protein n=1 Tax=Plakobranchus ocellatus TaxID=259542 RepID=A0AAV4AYN9_9GAST|nr:hypothetical protein PoB_004000000 [Plakobranchus ocellatus]
MHPKIQNATLECYSDTEKGFFQHPDTGENIATVMSDRLPPVVIFAIGLPDLKIREDDEGKYVEAKCSADVGPDGVLQWELFMSNGSRFCWIIDSEGKQYSTRQQLTRTSRRQEGGLQAQRYISHQRGTDEDRGHLSGVLAMHRILGVRISNDEETITELHQRGLT